MNFDLILLLTSSVAFLWLVYFFSVIWPEYVVETHRLSLFDLRYELFDLGASGKLDFNSDLYRSVEFDLNVMIRHLEKVSFTSIFAVYLAKKVTGEKLVSHRKPSFELIKASKNSDLKKSLESIVERAFLICMFSIVKRNIFVWSLARLIGVLFSLMGKGNSADQGQIVHFPKSTKNVIKNGAWAEMQYEEGVLKSPLAA